MFINSREEYESEGVRYEVNLDRRKAYAVAVLAEVWAGAELPPEMIREAKLIRRQMKKDGTWASA